LRFLLVFICLVVSACYPSKSPQSTYFWLDQAIVEKVRNGPSELISTRPQLEFDNGVSVHNCEQYLEQGVGLLETSPNFTARSHYLICDALKLSKKWPVDNNNAPFDSALSLCSALDLGSFRHSLRPRLQEDTATLAQLFGSEAIADGNTCTFEGEGRNFVLNAVLLVNEPAQPKKLWVWVTDEILDATYRTYTPIWFHFDAAQSMWVAKE
jgi:hypothetical protein